MKIVLDQCKFSSLAAFCEIAQVSVSTVAVRDCLTVALRLLAVRRRHVLVEFPLRHTGNTSIIRECLLKISNSGKRAWERHTKMSKPPSVLPNVIPPACIIPIYASVDK